MLAFRSALHLVNTDCSHYHYKNLLICLSGLKRKIKFLILFSKGERLLYLFFYHPFYSSVYWYTMELQHQHYLLAHFSCTALMRFFSFFKQSIYQSQPTASIKWTAKCFVVNCSWLMQKYQCIQLIVWLLMMMIFNCNCLQCRFLNFD